MTQSVVDDEQLLADFLECRLAPANFRHANHTHVTWMLLRRHPPAEAERIFCDALLRLATHLGAAQKYHHTLTIALVRLIRSRMANDPQAGWERFRSRNSDLFDEGRALIARHYSPAALESAAARQGFVAPDREPLP